MESQFFAFSQVLRQAAPADLPTALRDLPPVGTLPSPWTTWLYLALMDYRARQRWGRELLKKHLPQTVPPSPELCQRCQPVEATVPGAPDWEVLLECGYGFAELTHRVTGETIRVNLSEEDAEPIINVENLNYFVKPQSRWEAAGRLLELHPTFSTVAFAIEDLTAAQMMWGVHDNGERVPPDHQADAYCFLSPVGLAINAAKFTQRWRLPDNRLWLAALIGDWLLAHELTVAGGDDQLIALTGQRVEEVGSLRVNRARSKLVETKREHGWWDFASLEVLAEQKAEEVPKLIREGLAGEVQDFHAAMHLVHHDEASWCDEVFDALMRFGLEGTAPEAIDVLNCSEYLLAHHHHVGEVADVLARLGSMTTEAALLLLKHAPGLAMPFIHRGLREDGRFGNSMAVVLALLDRPWSRVELLAVLEDDVYHDLDEVLPVVLALEQSHDAEARHVAEVRLMKYDPERVELGQMHFDGLAERLGDQVMPLRGQTPV